MSVCDDYSSSSSCGRFLSLTFSFCCVPLPKKSSPMENNDYRPIALTPCVMKCFKRYMVSLLKTEVKPVLDPFQFAYRERCGTEDSVNTITNANAKHLESESLCTVAIC